MDLHYYAALGHTEKVRELLNESNAQHHDHSNKTVMHYAAINGNVEMVDLILPYVDKSLIMEENGPYELAVKHYQFEVIERFMMTYSIDCDELMCEAASQGSINLVKTLLKYAKKDIPLYSAAEAGHANIVELLIQYGADVYYKQEEYTPLHVAIARGHVYVVRVLIPYFTNINMATLEDYTALHLAILFKQVEIVKDLLSHPDIDVHVMNKNNTLLDFAKYYGTDEMVFMLIDHGVTEMNPISSCIIL